MALAFAVPKGSEVASVARVLASPSLAAVTRQSSFSSCSLPSGVTAAALGATTACIATAVRASRQRARASKKAHPRFARNVAQRAALELLESQKGDFQEAIADVCQQLTSAVSASGAPSFALVCVPPKWAADMSEATMQLKNTGAMGATPLIGIQNGASDTLRVGLAQGGRAISFFSNKEDLSQAGGGLAKSASASVPGVPDGCPNGSFLLFADPAIPAVLTRNLLEALDGRYKRAGKVGVVVMPVKAGDNDDDDDDWEPPKDGSRQLRPRDRTDGHGWISGDPTWNVATDVSGSHVVEFKKRPCGVKRYTPGDGGKGAMIMEMVEKSRYPGDALGQAATGGCCTGMVVQSVNGKNVLDSDFEDIMMLLADEGILDPDSKSAATWGDTIKGQQQRAVIAEAELPMTIDFASLSSSGGAKGAPLSLDGLPKYDGILGLALDDNLSSALDLFQAVKIGPPLAVKSAGVLSSGGFAVNSVEINGKELAAASALKMAAKAAGLTSMKGLCVGIPRPDAVEVDSLASTYALFPLASVTKQGGLLLRCKGLLEEGLGANDSLQSVQLFAPATGATAAPDAMWTKLGSALSGPSGAVAAAGRYGSLAFATRPEALQGAPANTLGVVGVAVLGAAGTKMAEAAEVLDLEAGQLQEGTDNDFSRSRFPACLHRQASAVVVLSSK